MAHNAGMIDAAWDRNANIGISCGPNGLVVLDEDLHGELAAWAVTYGIELPETYTVTTGRGAHHYYEWDHKTRGRIGNTVKLNGFELDVRGDGGYTVAEGSQHASGAVYTGNLRPIAPLPDAVAELLRVASGPQRNGTPKAAPGAGEQFFNQPNPRNPNEDRIGFGERHKQLVAYAGRLLARGLDYTEAETLFKQRWLLCEQPTGQIPEARYHGAPPAHCNYPVTWAEAKAKLRDTFGRYPAGQPATPDCVGGGEQEATTWEAIDLTPWLSGEYESPQPEVGISRTDGQKLLYAGREHTVFGETEAGKSWFALECCATEIRMGRDVVYIHYEEGDPCSTIERLLLLNVTRAQIATHLRFVAPARPVQGAWLAPLIDPPPVLVIHDGVNEAMSLHGDDTNQADGTATFRRTIIKPFLAVGAASLSCDHVTKGGGDNRGRYAMGSAHKINAIDGAAFLMENIKPFGRGLRGASSIYVTKDRPGQLRAHGVQAKGAAGKTLIGVLAVDDTGNSPDFLTFHPPKDADGAGQEEPRDPEAELAEQTYQIIAAQPDRTVASWRPLKALLKVAGIKVRDEALRNALEDLVLAKRLVEIPGKSNSKAYRAAVSVSHPSGHEVHPRSVSVSVSPIGGDTGTQSQTSVSDTAGHTGTQSVDASCDLCAKPLLAPESQIAGICERCRIAAKGAPLKIQSNEAAS